MNRTLIIIGAAIILIGLAWPEQTSAFFVACGARSAYPIRTGDVAEWLKAAVC